MRGGFLEADKDDHPDVLTVYGEAYVRTRLVLHADDVLLCSGLEHSMDVGNEVRRADCELLTTQHYFLYRPRFLGTNYRMKLVFGQ